MPAFKLQSAARGGKVPLYDGYVGNATALVPGCLVRLDAGFVVLAGLGNRIFGIYNGAAYTGTGAETSANTKQIEIIGEGDYLWGTADAVMAQAQIGTYYDILASSVQVDQSSTGTAAAQLCLLYLPDANDLTIGVWAVVERQLQR